MSAAEPPLAALDLVVAPYGPDPARPGAPRPVVEVAVGDLDGKPALLRALADALGFPPYFGHNWDALHDALTDPSWLPPSGFVLRLRGWGRFAAAHPADAATLRQVVEASGGREDVTAGG